MLYDDDDDDDKAHKNRWNSPLDAKVHWTSYHKYAAR